MLVFRKGNRGAIIYRKEKGIFLFNFERKNFQQLVAYNSDKDVHTLSIDRT